MAPRQELVSSAVNFLRDPSVASSPLEKRLEFLKSKNLTQEEIDAALAQAAGDSAGPSPPQSAPYYPPPQAYQASPQPGYNYGYPPPGQWNQPPPEPPKRDWRDWFIMATVVGGASYGLYMLAQRYVKPLIAPPTPPQLEQDKAAIDEQFNRAFALLDTLASDTATLKEAEEARTKKLDVAITDIENIVQELKSANQKREDDARRMEAEVRGMKDSLPRAIDTVREGSERQLKELSTELASLKLLMGNRMGANSSTSFFQNSGQTTTRSATTTPVSEVAPGSKGNVTGVNGTATAPSFSYSQQNTSTPASSAATRPSFGAGSKPTIPLWQMNAQKSKDASSTSTANSSTTTSQATAQDGADVVNILNSS